MFAFGNRSRSKLLICPRLTSKPGSRLEPFAGSLFEKGLCLFGRMGRAHASENKLLDPSVAIALQVVHGNRLARIRYGDFDLGARAAVGPEQLLDSPDF